LYFHLTRGDIEPKENDQVIPDTNVEDEMDNEAVGNFLDVDSDGSLDSSSVKRKRKRCCKSCKLGKHRSQKDKTHEIANLDTHNNDNEEFPDVGIDGIIGDEAEEMAVDGAGAEEVVNE